MLPDLVLLENGETISIKEYCNNHCPQRFNSECFSDCDLSREYEEQFSDNDYYCDNDE